MRLPQELADSIIDHIGIIYTQSSDIDDPTHLHESQCAKGDLKSLALVSRACNHRARSHLFAECRVDSQGSLEKFKHCSDTLLRYTRTLTVNQHGYYSIKIFPLLSRLVSSQLVTMTLLLRPVPKELPETLKSSFPNPRSVVFGDSLFSRSTLVNSIGALERLDMLHIQNCYPMPPTEDEKIPSLPPLNGQLSILDFNVFTINELSQIPLRLRSLRYASIGLPAENKLINAWAESLENLEVSMFVDWGA